MPNLREMAEKGRLCLQKQLIRRRLSVPKVLGCELLLLTIGLSSLYVCVVQPMIPVLRGQLELSQQLREQARLRKAREDVERLEGLVQAAQDREVTVEDLPALITELTRERSLLDLVSIAARPHTSKEGAQDGNVALDVSVKGDYRELVNYLRTMEEIPHFRLLRFKMRKNIFDLSFAIIST